MEYSLLIRLRFSVDQLRQSSEICKKFYQRIIQDAFEVSPVDQAVKELLLDAIESYDEWKQDQKGRPGKPGKPGKPNRGKGKKQDGDKKKKKKKKQKKNNGKKKQGK